MIAGRYELLERLGRGDTGEVHRARDVESGQEVALKLVPAASASRDDALRFLEQCRAAARIDAPGWLRPLDFGAVDAQTRFLALPLVPGEDLAARVAGGPLDAREACRIALELARTLAGLHARGYLHRDLKATNVRLGPAGEVTLLDFGFLTPLGEQADGTRLTGTPAYLAPEAIAGGTLTAATDLYALGCLLFELLTGRPPFAGSTAEVLRAQLLAPPPSAGPGAAGEIVASLLVKPPHARPRDARQVATRLAAAAGLPAPVWPVAPALLATDRLVGRAEELADLEEALGSVLAGAGRAVLVAAPSGVGKSRLVQELALHARLQQVAVTQAACREDGSEALQVVGQAWRPLLARCSAETRAALAADLAPVLPAADGPASLPGTTGKARLHLALATVLREVASALPQLMVIDDLQWADAASLEALNAVMRATREDRVLWLLTLRPEEAPPGHAAWDAADEGLARVLRLAPLDAARTEALVAALLDGAPTDAALARLLHDTTGGNPLFLIETLRHLIEDEALALGPEGWRPTRALERVDLPEAAEAAVLRRLANLPPAAAGLLRLAVVLGPTPARDQLAEASGLAEADFLAALDPLVERQFLVASEAGYRLPHDRPREAVYGAIPVAERRALHRRCGEALERLAGDRPPSPDLVAALAHHFTRAADTERAHRYGVQAAEQARDRAPARALAAWQQTDDLLATADPDDHAGRRAALWWEIGRAGFEMRPDLASTALERLLAVLPPDAPRRLEAEAFLATAHGFAGEPERGLAAAERAYERAATAGSVLQAATLMVRGPSLLAAGRIDELVAAASRARAVLEELDPAEQPAIVRATRIGAISYQLAVCYQGLAPPDGVLEQALEAAERAGALNLHLTIRHYAPLAAAWQGDLDPARAYIAWAGPFGRRIGAPPHPWLLLLEALVPFQAGDFGAAAAAIERARQMRHLALAGATRHQLDVLAARVRLARGDAAGALEDARRALAEARERGLTLGEHQAHLALAEVAVARKLDPGEPLDAAIRLAVAGPGRNPLFEAIARRLQTTFHDAARHARAAAEARWDHAASLLPPIEI